MTYGYIRVSTDKQTVENQRFEIERFCERQKMKVNGWIEETVSGTKEYNKRQLGTLLKQIKKGDTIICSELSRLGRSLFMIMEILSYCMKKECKVWTIKDNYRLGEDIQSKVLAFAFGLSAEIERNLISQRTKEALARKKVEGVKLGRQKGYKADVNSLKLAKYREEIVQYIEDHVSVYALAYKYKVSRNTMTSFIKKIGYGDLIKYRKNQKKIYCTNKLTGVTREYKSIRECAEKEGINLQMAFILLKDVNDERSNNPNLKQFNVRLSYEFPQY